MAVSQSLTLTQASQNIAGNYSKVRIVWQSTQTYDSWNGYTRTAKYYVSINGGAETEYSVNYTLPKGTTTTILDTEITVNHKADGTGSVKVRTWMDTDISAGVVTQSKTLTLSTIPRATTPTVGASVRDMGDYVTIYTAAASAAFTHDLAYSFMGGAYQTIATGVKEWHNWTIPDLASQIPNAASGTVTIRCITKNGSSAIGTKTVTMTLKVLASVVPTISTVTATENTSGLAAQFGAFIQGKSALAVKITAAGAKGSTISSYKATLQGVAYTGASFTTGVLQQEGSHSLEVTVTDSRGRTTSETVAITVLPYTRPSTSEFKAFRSDANGSAQDDGTYLSVAYAYSVASLGGKNTAVMVIEYKTETGTTWTRLATGSDLDGSGIRFFYDGPTFSTDYQYDVRMTVTDWFGASTSYEVTLPTADVVLDISADGKGLGIGKVSQRSGATEFARVMFDRFDTVIGNGLAVYGGSGDSGIDPDTTLEHLILTDKNTPAAGFWYIQTLFYSTKSVTANRTQFALPYQADGSIWVRRYFSGAWTEWMGSPTLIREYDYGIWHVRYWSDGWLDMTGSLKITNLPCNTALGSWYRTAVFDSGMFPAPMDRPVVTANYESDGYGALLWATTEATNEKGPSYYLIRPTSTTIASGRVQLRVTGRHIETGGSSSGVRMLSMDGYYLQDSNGSYILAEGDT